MASSHCAPRMLLIFVNQRQNRQVTTKMPNVNVSILISVVSDIIQEDDDLVAIEELSVSNIAQQVILGSSCGKIQGQFIGIQNYIENVVNCYSDPYFKRHFRMSRHCLEALVNKVGNCIEEDSCLFVYPLHTKLLITLWTLGNKESFRGIGDRFGMIQGTAHMIFLGIARVFRTFSQEFIQWPEREQWEGIAAGFTFPNTLGAIDGTFIRIRQPLKNCSAYTNRKKFCAVTLQVICKGNREFLDVSTGYPSSMHDAAVFRHSRIGRNLMEILAGTHFHLIADSAYPLTIRLMKPYQDTGNLSDENKQFNRLLSSNRAVVERAIWLLKGKWRRLLLLDMLLLQRIPDVIITACCLHNHVIQFGDLDTEEFTSDEDEDGSDDDSEEEYDGSNNSLLMAGITKRNRLKDIIFS